jgi:hypothetical protein
MMIDALQFVHVTAVPTARFGTQLVVKHEVQTKVIVQSLPGGVWDSHLTSWQTYSFSQFQVRMPQTKMSPGGMENDVLDSNPKPLDDFTPTPNNCADKDNSKVRAIKSIREWKPLSGERLRFHPEIRLWIFRRGVGLLGDLWVRTCSRKRIVVPCG